MWTSIWDVNINQGHLHSEGWLHLISDSTSCLGSTLCQTAVHLSLNVIFPLVPLSSSCLFSLHFSLQHSFVNIGWLFTTTCQLVFSPHKCMICEVSDSIQVWYWRKITWWVIKKKITRKPGLLTATLICLRQWHSLLTQKSSEFLPTPSEVSLKYVMRTAFYLRCWHLFMACSQMEWVVVIK